MSQVPSKSNISRRKFPSQSTKDVQVPEVCEPRQRKRWSANPVHTDRDSITPESRWLPVYTKATLEYSIVLATVIPCTLPHSLPSLEGLRGPAMRRVLDIAALCMLGARRWTVGSGQWAVKVLLDPSECLRYATRNPVMR